MDNIFQKTPGKMLARQKRSMEAPDHSSVLRRRHGRKMLHCT
jgi:hypothetical protein